MKRSGKRNILHVPAGWQCPRCVRVHAPWIMQCTCAVVTAPDQWPGEPDEDDEDDQDGDTAAEIKPTEYRTCRVRHTPNALHAYRATLKGRGVYGWGDTPAMARDCLRRMLRYVESPNAQADRPAKAGERGLI